jgi:hypothetical protein
LLGITALSQSPIASLGGTNVDVAVTGIQLTSSINSVIAQADANAFPTSQLLTTIVDAVVTKADANVFPTGIQLSPNLGNVDIDLNTPVDVTGED